MANDVIELLEQLKHGDAAAAQQLWDRFFASLVRVAQQRLGKLPQRTADGEDIALSALNSFVQAARADRFPRLTDETDLWRLLVTITARKVGAQRRRHFSARRGNGAVRGESAFAGPDGANPRDGIDQLAADQLTPAFAAEMAEEMQRLFDCLGDPLLRQIAQCKFEGFSNEEIAIKIDRNLRTVERKLQLIRHQWSAAIASP